MALTPNPPRRPALGLAFALAWLAAPALAAPDVVVITGAWMRPAPARANVAGYLAITNHGRLPDTLIAVASPAAAKASIHESRRIGPMVIMRRLQVLAIAPGATATFAPGGLHLMLENLRKPVKIGDRVPVVLTFDRTGSMRVVFEVRSDATAPAAGGMRMQDADSPPR